MSLIDWYEPTENLTCPCCSHTLSEWQGTDGPCGLLVWRQGNTHPVEQRLDDDDLRWTELELRKFVLPIKFTIYSYDCPKHSPIYADCTCKGEVWEDLTLRSRD